MGEHLKGLYTAVNSITNIFSENQKMNSEMKIIVNICKEMSEFAGEINKKLVSSVEEMEELRRDLITAVTLRNEISAERVRISTVASEKISNLQERLMSIEEDCTKLRTDAQKYEKRYNDLSEEYEKLRNRLRQYRVKRRQFGEVEEKVCKQCQKVYTEKGNFNWSCKCHTGEYGTDMWWCCGKRGREAEGCRTAKHVSNEEEDTAERGEEQRMHSVQCPV